MGVALDVYLARSQSPSSEWDAAIAKGGNWLREEIESFGAMWNEGTPRLEPIYDKFAKGAQAWGPLPHGLALVLIEGNEFSAGLAEGTVGVVGKSVARGLEMAYASEQSATLGDWAAGEGREWIALASTTKDVAKVAVHAARVGHLPSIELPEARHSSRTLGRLVGMYVLGAAFQKLLPIKPNGPPADVSDFGRKLLEREKELGGFLKRATYGSRLEAAQEHLRVLRQKLDTLTSGKEAPLAEAVEKQLREIAEAQAAISMLKRKEAFVSMGPDDAIGWIRDAMKDPKYTLERRVNARYPEDVEEFKRRVAGRIYNEVIRRLEAAREMDIAPAVEPEIAAFLKKYDKVLVELKLPRRPGTKSSP